MDNLNISSDLIRGHINTIILCSLAEGDKYGYQICKFIDDKTNGKYELKLPSLYSSLKRLESIGHVSSHWGDSDIGGRRRYFHLTDDGKKEIESNLVEWQFSRSIIDQLVFGAVSPIPASNGNSAVATISVAQKTETDNNTKTTETEQKPISPISSEQIVKPSENEQLKDVPPTPRKSLYEAFAEIDKANENKPNNVEAQKIEEKPKEEDKQSDFDLFEYGESEREKNYKQLLYDILPHSAASSTQTASAEESEDTTAVVRKTVSYEQATQNKEEPSLTIRPKKFGQIDYSDIFDKAQADGYEVSVTNNARAAHYVFTRKLNFFAILLTSLAFIVEYLLIIGINFSVLNYSPLVLVALCFIAVLPVGIFGGLYLAAPNQKKRGNVNFKGILATMIIVAMNVILFTLAIYLLTNMQFSDTPKLISFFVLPITAAIDLPLYSIIKKLLYQFGNFKETTITNR